MLPTASSGWHMKNFRRTNHTNMNKRPQQGKIQEYIASTEQSSHSLHRP